jgi:hypothetical protein
MQRRVIDASVLYEVPYKKGDERSQGHNNEKWQTGHSRNLSRMRNQDVQNRQELALERQSLIAYERLATLRGCQSLFLHTISFC